MGSWGIGPFDNDDASEALYELNECRDEKKFAEGLLNLVQYDQSSEFDEDDEYKAIAASAVLCLILAQQETGTLKLESVEGSSFDFQVPSDAQNISKKFSSVDLTRIIPEAMKALSKIESNDSYVYELREGNVHWLKGLADLKLGLNAHTGS